MWRIEQLIKPELRMQLERMKQSIRRSEISKIGCTLSFSPRKARKAYDGSMRSAGVTVTCKILKCAVFLFACGLLWSFPLRAETGIASYYGAGEKLNRYTANGDLFNPKYLTAASYQWPMGSYVSCTAPETGRTIVVLINDLGPNKRLGRLIDLTRASFRILAGNTQKGTITVSCKQVSL